MSKILYFLTFIFVLKISVVTSDEIIKPEVKQNISGILNRLKDYTNWAIREEHIYKLAKERIINLKKQIAILEKYIEDYKESSEKVGRNATTVEERARLVASNGITTYRMVYRFITYLQELRDLMAEDNGQQLRDYLEKTEKEEGGWPSEVDKNKSMLSFVKVQDVLDINLEDLWRFLAKDGDTKPLELPAYYCAQIGLHAMDQGLFFQAVEWLEYTRKKVLVDWDLSIDLNVVEEHLATVIKAHNDAYATVDELQLSVFDHNVTAGQRNRIKRRDLYMEEMTGLEEIGANEAHFWSLCSGKILRNDLHKLSCYYDSKVHPIWKIGPLKIEELNKNPKVIQIHDILGENEIQDIIDKAEGKFFSSKIFVNDFDTEENVARTSVQATIHNHELPRLNLKVELFTGLKAVGQNDSEQLAVVEYVFGRYYAQHNDAFNLTGDQITNPKMCQKNGDRAVTVLFYLNDVEKGGATPLLNIMTAAAPVKGSAIVWHNLFRNGTAREDTWHGACPVFRGHKIVANKWIRYNSQFQKLMCSLNQFE